MRLLFEMCRIWHCMGPRTGRGSFALRAGACQSVVEKIASERESGEHTKNWLFANARYLSALI